MVFGIVRPVSTDSFVLPRSKRTSEPTEVGQINALFHFDAFTCQEAVCSTGLFKGIRALDPMSKASNGVAAIKCPGSQRASRRNRNGSARSTYLRVDSLRDRNPS